MKLSCTQENLAKGLSIVGRSVGVRTTLPVLNNILMQTQKGRLKLSATDLEIGIHTWIGAKVDDEGGITVPARLLLDFVNTNNDQTINFELKDTTLKLGSDHYKANINGIEASEFPLIPEVKKDREIELPAKEFVEAINRVIIGTATDESRPVLAGVYLYTHNQELKMVATDSYRLAEQTITLAKNPPAGGEPEIALILPQRTMAELARIINESVSKIKIYPGENQVEFLIGDTVLVSRLIEGTFPDYAQIIPSKAQTIVTLATAEFANAIKMASLFARESANNIKLKVTDKTVEIIAVSPHVGDNISTVKGTIKGETVEIAFNAKFILDVLQVLGSDETILEFSGNMTAGLIKGAKTKNYLYVLMPLRIDE